MTREPLAASGAYSPFILDCGRFDGRSEPWHIGSETAADFDNGSYHLLHLLDGAGSCRLDGVELTCGPGAVLCWPPGVVGHLYLPPGAWCIQAAFDVVVQPRSEPGQRRRSRHHGAQPQPSPERVWGCDLPRQLTGPPAEAAALLLVRLASTYWRDALSHFFANDALAAWLADLVARQSDRPLLSTSFRPAGDPVAAALELGGQALSHRLTVDTLARATGLARSTFHRRFQQRTGERPAGHLRQRRLQRAGELLTSTDLPVQQIGRIVGYRDATAFGRAFKKALGMTPGRWRREHGKAGSAVTR